MDWSKHHGLTAEALLLIFRNGLWFVVVLCFIRPAGTRDFLKRTGLNTRPTFIGWLATWPAIIIGFVGLYASARAWIPENHAAVRFYGAGVAARGFFVAYAVLLAPFSEELMMRGFLYPTFRSGYGRTVSTLFVLAVHSYFHWGLLAHSIYALASLYSIEVLLCWLRERTGNVWNCFLFHGMYNATQSIPWLFCLVGMLGLLVVCNPYRKPPIENPEGDGESIATEGRPEGRPRTDLKMGGFKLWQ